MNRQPDAGAAEALGRAAAAATSTADLHATALPAACATLGAQAVAVWQPQGDGIEVVGGWGLQLDPAGVDPDYPLGGDDPADVPQPWQDDGVVAARCLPLVAVPGWLVVAWTDGSTPTDRGHVATAAATIGSALARLAATAELEDLIRRVDNAQQLAHMGDYDWHIASDTNRWSDQLYRIYGYEPQSFNASYERFLSLLHPDDRERIQQVHQQAYATGEPYEMIERIVRPDGDIRYLASNGQVIMDESGTPVRMRGTCIDITDRILAEQEVARAGARFRSLVESAPDAVLVMDSDGRFTQCNARAHDLLGGDPVGARLSDLLAEDLPFPGAGTDRRAAAARTSLSRDAVRATALDGTALHLDVTIAALGPEVSTPSFAVFLHDARGRLEREALTGRVREARVRRRQALEINDNVVQGLAAALYAHQQGDVSAAGVYLDRTLTAARRMMDDLLEPLAGEDLQAGDLVRSRPSADAPAVIPARRPPVEPASDGSGARVLVIDDSADMRLLIGTLLDLAPEFTVVGEAADGRSGVAMAEDLRPDIVVLDLAMPVMDGLQALPLLRAVLPDATIVVLSGFDGATMSDRAVDAGADDYLEKGRALEDLHAAVRRAHRRRADSPSRASGS